MIRVGLRQRRVGRLAQLARARGRHPRGHWFESNIAHFDNFWPVGSAVIRRDSLIFQPKIAQRRSVTNRCVARWRCLVQRCVQRAGFLCCRVEVRIEQLQVVVAHPDGPPAAAGVSVSRFALQDMPMQKPSARRPAFISALTHSRPTQLLNGVAWRPAHLPDCSARSGADRSFAGGLWQCHRLT